MRKGQKVRILRTNQIATIVEVELIRKSGKVHRYCHLKMDKKPDLWMDASELGGLVERCRITFHDDRGQELYFDVERDYRKENLSVTLTGKNPENLKEHHGINIMMPKCCAEVLKHINNVLDNSFAKQFLCIRSMLRIWIYFNIFQTIVNLGSRLISSQWGWRNWRNTIIKCSSGCMGCSLVNLSGCLKRLVRRIMTFS